MKDVRIGSTVVVAGHPGIQVPADAVPGECARCSGEVRIARSTAWALNDTPDVPLLCWACAQVLIPNLANTPQMGVAQARRLGRIHPAG